jgi:hypothetical protein
MLESPRTKVMLHVGRKSLKWLLCHFPEEVSQRPKAHQKKRVRMDADQTAPPTLEQRGGGGGGGGGGGVGGGAALSHRSAMATPPTGLGSRFSFDTAALYST